MPAALRECISISHLSIFRPSSIVCVSVRAKQEGGTTTLWQVSIVNCQVVCCCHWQFANGIWQALSLIPTRVGSWGVAVAVGVNSSSGLYANWQFEVCFWLWRGAHLSRVCPEVVKVAAQLTASSPCRRTMMTSVIMMTSPPFECDQIVRVAVCEIQKGIAFFLPIWVPFYGHNTHTHAQHETQDSTRRRDAPQQATKFSEAHRNDTMPIARWLIGVSWVVGQQKSPMKWRNDGMTHGIAGKQQRAI